MWAWWPATRSDAERPGYSALYDPDERRARAGRSCHTNRSAQNQSFPGAAGPSGLEGEHCDHAKTAVLASGSVSGSRTFPVARLTAQSRVSPFRISSCPISGGYGSWRFTGQPLATGRSTPSKVNFSCPTGPHRLSGKRFDRTRAFDEAWVEGGKPFTVFIGLRKWNYSKEKCDRPAELKEIGKYRPASQPPPIRRKRRTLHQPGPAAKVGATVSRSAASLLGNGAGQGGRLRPAARGAA